MCVPQYTNKEADAQFEKVIQNGRKSLNLLKSKGFIKEKEKIC